MLDTSTADLSIFTDMAHEIKKADNAHIQLPVSWVPDTITLQIRSTSVVHVRLLADLNNGRLHRFAGDLLCRPIADGASTTDDANILEVNREHPVTCRACLHYVERWNT